MNGSDEDGDHYYCGQCGSKMAADDTGVSTYDDVIVCSDACANEYLEARTDRG